MKSMRRLVLVLAAVGALFISVVGAVGAQDAESMGYLAAVNGASTDPVGVAAGTIPIGTGPLDYAADGESTLVPAGDYVVTFTGGSLDSAVPVQVEAGSAQTVVSGYGEGDNTAFAYPVDVDPIAAGMAKVTVWNATGARVDVKIDDGDIQTLEPGEGLPTTTVPADTLVSVTIDAVTREIATPADSYTDVFAVNDIQEGKIAISVVPSMAALIDQIAPPTPPDTVPVPDVAGQPAADGQAAIEAAGLVAATEEASSDTVEAGLVIETNPASGTEVAAGSTVTMVVSTGPDAPATVPVPDVVGQSAADAQSMLEYAGLAVTTTEQSSEGVEAGLVIATNPSAGTEVALGTTVDMAVSTGPGDVAVPDFIGMTVDEATAAAEDAGLTIRFVEDSDDPDPDGLVIDQDPVPGVMAEAGSEVVAQLSPAIDDAWVILTLDPNRQMAVSGINFEAGSTTTLQVVGTNLSDTALVDTAGSWVARFDLSGVQNEAEILLVTGTAADGNEYEQTFKIPAAGESTDVPSDATEESSDGGFPWWGWLLIGLGVVGIGALIWWLVAGRDQSSTSGGDSTTTGDKK